ncbi:MAG: UDP-N-acetylmuramoyl-L-alanyl-D-glutamate--2,6-diaminopimelate ligase [Bauldia sp.]|nr:UDP-N-acetylmuramoyl-L-alanyl-D-glutamate--2,6-diaminopimelate ligase [Bauldia sp.]
MRLSELSVAEISTPQGAENIDVSGLTADSRTVGKGFVFAALRGASADGTEYVPKAIEKGAAAILAASDADLPPGMTVPILRTLDPRRGLALLAARFYPRQPEKVVAVTGTSGKTSVSVFVRQIFEAAGFDAASLGTIGVVTRRGAAYGSLTTPDPVALHQIIDRLVGEGVTRLALEASSHGIEQRRLDGLRLTAAGFTNLGRDHLDYHSDMESYFQAKLRLFDTLLPDGAAAVVDVDSEAGQRVAKVAADRGLRLIRTGTSGVELRLVEVAAEGLAQTLTIEAFGKRRKARLPLAGAFQVSNALVAAGLTIGAGLDVERALEGLGTLKGAPGRLEFVAEADGASIVIDYAHKPEALASVLAALRPVAKGRLIVVFGAGGNRDKGKRPLMGKAASAGADIVIVTDDNPRNEAPAAIRAEILAGAPGAIEIGDRAEAIRSAIAMLRPGDVLCVAGKGHETGQTIGERVIPFSDHQVVSEALASREPA